MPGTETPNPVQLTDSLHKLKIQQEANISDSPPLSSTSETHDTHIQQQADDQPQKQYSRSPPSRDGYGFRKSGINTPFYPSQQVDPGPVHQRLNELVPDPNGLGWPGKYS